MKKVFIIHGFGGAPNGGWFPWLMGELAKNHTFACSLPMPNTNDPLASEWVTTMHSYIEPNEEVFIVGHSLGGPAVLRYLESLPDKVMVGGVLLVSPVFEKLDVEDLSSDFRKIDNFFTTEFNFKKIKECIKKSIIVHGGKDPIVPLAHSEKISQGLDSELVVVENGDHFSQKTEPICYQLPEAFDALMKMIK